MTNHTVPHRSRYLFYRVVALTALVLVLGSLPRAVFAEAATNVSAMKIGIIGSGNIGSTLGTLWVKSGHSVLFSSRHPEQLTKLAESLGPLARAGTVREALAFGDVVLVAVPYGAYPQIGKDYAREFIGKIVIDAGNAVLARDGEITKEAREKGIGITPRRNIWPGRALSGHSTRSTIAGWRSSPTERKAALPSPWQGTTRMRWRWRRPWCETRALIR
jgi:8-hydroxy-5-deazaflavin:NADPH oxidoreductase